MKKFSFQPGLVSYFTLSIGVFFLLSFALKPREAFAAGASSSSSSGPTVTTCRTSCSGCSRCIDGICVAGCGRSGFCCGSGADATCSPCPCDQKRCGASACIPKLSVCCVGLDSFHVCAENQTCCVCTRPAVAGDTEPYNECCAAGQVCTTEGCRAAP